VLIAATYCRFLFTTFLYTLLAAHSLILMVGGHYTYAEVPLFNWLRDIGIFSRNNYDKVGHLAQGFFPAILAREILIRTSLLAGSRWLGFLSVSVCLAFSALYEIMEWWVSVLGGSKGDAFLGRRATSGTRSPTCSCASLDRSPLCCWSARSRTAPASGLASGVVARHHPTFPQFRHRENSWLFPSVKSLRQTNSRKC
jgi:uncharacterized membrane protein YjdF